MRAAHESGSDPHTGRFTAIAIMAGVALFLLLAWSLRMNAVTLIQQARADSGSTVFTAGYTADLAITAVGPSSVDRGKTFTETFTVVNRGPSVAHGVTVTGSIPLGYTFQKTGSSSVCDASASQFTCNLGTIPDNLPRPVTIAFLTRTQDMCYANTYQVNATVRGSESDPNQVNNTSNTIATAIRCPPNLPQCSDGIDHDSDGLIDASDPGCHTDGNAKNPASYDPNGTSESQDQLNVSLEQSRLRQQLRIQARQPGFHFVSQAASSSSVSSSSSLRPLPLAPSVPVLPSTSALTIRLNQSQGEAQPGDTVFYTILLRNASDQPVQGAQVTFQYPVSQLSVSGVQGAQQSDGQMQWSVDIAPHQQRVLRVSGRVDPSAAQGSQIVTSAQVAGAATVRSVAVLSILSKLPKTGAGYTGPLENTAAFLSPMASGSPAMLWFALACVGVTAGSLIGRRFFL